MNPQQRQAHLKKVASTPVISSRCVLSDAAKVSSAPLSLSVDVDNVASMVTIPLSCLQGIWSKATELLNTPNAIASAPGHPLESKMVLSRSGQRPHLVLPTKDSFKCDSNCMNFKSLGLCSAVAELHNKLGNFITKFAKAKKQPNFSPLAVHGMPAGRGRKGSQVSRKRKKSQPVTEREDRLSTFQRVSGSSNQTVNILIDSPKRQRSDGNIASESSFMTPGASYTTQYTTPGPSHTTPGPSHIYMTPGPSHMAPGPSYMAPGPSYMTPGPSYMTPSYQDRYGTGFSPPQMAQDTSEFVLVKIANVCKCAGCSNKYAKPTVPPFDLCVQHREWRYFTSPTGSQQSKFSPAYYHVNLPCIHHKWPQFSPSDLVISQEMSLKLTQIHKDFLSAFGCCSVY